MRQVNFFRFDYRKSLYILSVGCINLLYINLYTFKASDGLPKANSTRTMTVDDPNRSCTWLEYNDYDYPSAESIGSYGDSSSALERCIEVGKNKCNAVRYRNMNCWRCPPRYYPIFISGEAEKPADGYSYATYIMGECNMWQKWPGHFLAGEGIEEQVTLSAAQERCHELGPTCNAIKRRGVKYLLVGSQEMPTKRKGTWSDYWVKLPANN